MLKKPLSNMALLQAAPCKSIFAFYTTDQNGYSNILNFIWGLSTVLKSDLSKLHKSFHKKISTAPLIITVKKQFEGRLRYFMGV